MSPYALLSDGTTVRLRPAEPSDEAALARMYAAMSADHRYLRFLGFGTMGADAARRACRPPGDRAEDGGHAAVLAVLDDEVIGVAEYEPTGEPGVGEVACAVADGHHGRGVATLLLEHLVAQACDHGLRTLVADTLAYNHPMLAVFADMGLRIERHLADSVVSVRIPLTEDPDYLAAMAARERAADLRSLQPLLRPASVAVIGASRRAHSVGRAVHERLLSGGFHGPVYPVNPHADEVSGVPCHRSVHELPEPPDLAVLAVPAGQVPAVAQECGARGVRALLVLTAGLDAEQGAALLDACRQHGMRLVGPNCLGIANTDPEVRLDATFGARAPLPGTAGVAVQSGGVGIAVLEHLGRLGIGISSFVSLGDKYDVSGNDLLQWWSADDVTRLGVLHLESFGNPRAFSRTAQRVTRAMPVLTVVAGRSAAGQRAAASHTAAAATPLVSREALFRQAGVIATRSIGELVEAAALLASQPLPGGSRVAIVSNAGGAGVLAADACSDAGLRVPALDADLTQRVLAALPAGAVATNPVDTTAAVTAEQLGAAVDLLAGAAAVDALLVVVAPTALGDLLPALTGAPATRPVPLLAVRLDQPSSVELLAGSDGARLPTYAEPAAAAWALSRACQHADRLRSERGAVPDLADLDEPARQTAAGLVEGFLREHPDGGWLPPDAVTRLLGGYGLPVLPVRLATSADQAVAAAREVGLPVAVKAYWPGLVHKSDQDAVRLRLGDADAVRAAYHELSDRFGDRLAGVAVQPMAGQGIELLAGVVQDDVFGPLVVFGLGGVAADVLADRGARLTPLTDLDAAQLVRSIRTAPLLFGYRGTPPADVRGIEEALVRLSRLADDLPQIAEVDLNPLIAGDGWLAVADARVRVVPHDPVHPALRRLR